METPPPAPVPAPPVAKRRGCLRPLLIGCGAIFLLGVIVIGGGLTWIIAHRHRADRFGDHVKVGQSVVEVLGGSRDWYGIYTECAGADGKTRTVEVHASRGHYVVYDRDFATAPINYTDFDAVLRDLAAGAGPFAGRHEIGVEFVFTGGSQRTYVLTLGPDAKVAKIESFSRQ